MSVPAWAKPAPDVCHAHDTRGHPALGLWDILRDDAHVDTPGTGGPEHEAEVPEDQTGHTVGQQEADAAGSLQGLPPHHPWPPAAPPPVRERPDLAVGETVILLASLSTHVETPTKGGGGGAAQ